MRHQPNVIRIGLFSVALAAGVAALYVPATAQAPGAQAAAGQAETPRLTLTAGRSRIMATDFDVTRVSITDPTVADVTVVDTRELLIDGKGPGTVSLIIWGAATRVQYDVVIDPGVSVLQRQIQTIFPGEDITANETTRAVILTGHASNNTVMLRAGEIAQAIAPEANIVNLLQLPGGNGSQQVMLQVRVAEVNRRALDDLGASVFTGGTGINNVVGRIATQQFPTAGFSDLTANYDADGNLINSEGSNTFGDFLNLFLFSNDLKIGTLVKALQTSGNLQSLAEPNLIAYNGQEASFLAGGELPVPQVQGNSGQVSIEYKEFGIRLTFKPTIAGDVIRLKVQPEVSSLDFANGITLGGFRVPALITRRANTDVELRDGQSFAIAGLMNNVAQLSEESIPFLSKVPLIGRLFKGRSKSKENTELMVLVTPHLVRPLNPDEVPPLPVVPEQFMQRCPEPPCNPPARNGSGG